MLRTILENKLLFLITQKNKLKKPEKELKWRTQEMMNM